MIRNEKKHVLASPSLIGIDRGSRSDLAARGAKNTGGKKKKKKERFASENGKPRALVRALSLHISRESEARGKRDSTRRLRGQAREETIEA